MTYKKNRPNRKPSHPGAILKDLWLKELGYTQSEFAQKLAEVSTKDISKATMLTKLNEVLNEKRSMSAEFAVLISIILKTSPRMWLSLQMNLDLWQAQESIEAA